MADSFSLLPFWLWRRPGAHWLSRCWVQNGQPLTPQNNAQSAHSGPAAPHGGPGNAHNTNELTLTATAVMLMLWISSNTSKCYLIKQCTVLLKVCITPVQSNYFVQIMQIQSKAYKWCCIIQMKYLLRSNIALLLDTIMVHEDVCLCGCSCSAFHYIWQQFPNFRCCPDTESTLTLFWSPRWWNRVCILCTVKPTWLGLRMKKLEGKQNIRLKRIL